jgi:predicted nucleic acid-binding protein
VPHQIALIDAGPLAAYYDGGDKWHSSVQIFFDNFVGQLITSEPVTTEVMWLLQQDRESQKEFLTDLARGLYIVKPLEPGDYTRISTLNEKYKDVPADFADLSIVALSERLSIKNVASLDWDFDIYRSAGATFHQLLPKLEQSRKKMRSKQGPFTHCA